MAPQSGPWRAGPEFEVNIRSTITKLIRHLRKVVAPAALVFLYACGGGGGTATPTAGSDTLSVINTRTDRIVETICARQNPADLFGAQPNALAFDRRGKKLFVCNGTQNAVAVFQFKPGASKLLGLIPVGWFPGSIAFDSKRNALCVANLKDIESRHTVGTVKTVKPTPGDDAARPPVGRVDGDGRRHAAADRQQRLYAAGLERSVGPGGELPLRPGERRPHCWDD